MGTTKKLAIDLNREDERRKSLDLRNKKIKYFIDELSIFIITTISVLLSEAYKEMMKKGIASWSSVHLDSLTIALASMTSVIIYGILHTKIQYNDHKKPPYIKRAASAILYGVAAQSIIESRMGNLK